MKYIIYSLPFLFIAFGFADCTKNESRTITGAGGNGDVVVTNVQITGDNNDSNDTQDQSDSSVTDNSQ